MWKKKKRIEEWRMGRGGIVDEGLALFFSCFATCYDTTWGGLFNSPLRLVEFRVVEREQKYKDWKM